MPWVEASTIATCPRFAASSVSAAADDYRFKSIVLGVVSSDAFRKREAAAGSRLCRARCETSRVSSDVSVHDANVRREADDETTDAYASSVTQTGGLSSCS